MSGDTGSSGSDAGSEGARSETRKVQFVGGSTYTVSLPKSWADEHDIQAGTEIYLHPHTNGSLVLRPGLETDEDGTGVRVSVDGFGPRQLARVVRTMYVDGYDTIALVANEGFDGEGLQAVSDAANALIGAQVVTEDADRVVVRSLLDTGDVSVRQSVLQLEHVALEMHEDATAALFDGSVDSGHVAERHGEADRLFAMVARYFRRGLTDLSVIDRLGLDYPDLFEYYTAARQLGRVADQAETVAAIASAGSGTPDAGLAEPAGAARGVVADASSAFLEQSGVGTAYEILETCDAVSDDLLAADEATEPSLVVDTFVRTAACGGRIAETAIRAAVRRNGR